MDLAPILLVPFDPSTLDSVVLRIERRRVREFSICDPEWLACVPNCLFPMLMGFRLLCEKSDFGSREFSVTRWGRIFSVPVLFANLCDLKGTIRLV